MKTRNIVILLICIVIFFVVILFYSFRTRIPSNAPSTIGNTAGNLNNKGLFCENEGIVYFSNVYDNGSLYLMNPDTTNIKKIWNVPTKYINAAGKYLYYYQDSQSANSAFGLLGNMYGIYRIKKSGADNKSLDRTPSGIINLIGDYLYYQHYDDTDGMTLYRVKTDQTDKSQIMKAIVDPACAKDGIIYYHDMDHAFQLAAYDTNLDSSHTIYDGKLFNPILIGDYFYYMNVADNYTLYRYHNVGGEIEKLTNDRVDCFNVDAASGYIYYQKNDAAAPALKRMLLDGSSVEMIASGNYTNINITSTYTYFMLFDSDSIMYKTPTQGAISVTEFTEAAIAASENQEK